MTVFKWTLLRECIKGKRVKYFAVYKDSRIQLIDIFIEDKWFGSRRKLEECRRYARHVLS